VEAILPMRRDWVARGASVFRFQALSHHGAEETLIFFSRRASSSR
jgi:hypothetical protein